MKGRERILLVVGLGLIMAGAGALLYLKSHQRLGKPGLRAVAVAGTPRMHIELPTNALGFDCLECPPSDLVTNGLPSDTSFRGLAFTNAEGFIQVNVVMMGGDRGSIHRPQFCLTGDGWNIDPERSGATTVRLDRPRPLDLPVMKLIVQKKKEVDGKQFTTSGVYVYWFVADGVVTASHEGRMWDMAVHLLRTGELQRWSYVTYFAPCRPGDEDRAFRRIERLMNKTVPEFQLAWPAPVVTAGAAR